jgi:hypothetical protein
LKLSSEIQRSSSTHSRLIIAICAAGPPQASRPNFKKRMKIERSESMRLGAAASEDKVARLCLAREDFGVVRLEEAPPEAASSRSLG